MEYWGRQRKIALVLHVIFLAIPFGAATVASWTYWYSWFNDAVVASLIVCSYDIVALTGLLAYIARIPWPLKGMRHLLPVASTVPLMYEVFQWISGVDWWGGVVVAVGLGLWGIYLAQRLFSSFEQLFVPQTVLIQERARAELAEMQNTLTSMREQRRMVDSFLLLAGQAPAVLRLEESRTLTEPLQQIEELPNSSEPARYTCGKCGANHLAAGRDPGRMHAATSRTGCSQCRGGS